MKAAGYLWPVIFIVASAQNAAAQSGEPLNSERPSFSASPFVLSPGMWQIETGFQYVDDDSGADYSLLVLPQALLRYGMSDEVELQLSLPSLVWRDAGNVDDSGMSDAAFGVKIQMTDDTASTSVAFLAGVSLPTGDDEFSSDRVDPRIGAAWAHSRFFGTATITRADGDYFFENGFGVNFALRNATNAFAEWQATIPDSGGSIHRLNGGWLWAPRNKVQWDVSASLGLNERAPDFSIGGGFSYRF